MITAITNSIFPLSTNSIQEIESMLTIEYFKKGETFIAIGRRNIKEYFLLEGVCKSYLINPDGDEITISLFASNSILSPYTTRTQNEISVLSFKALTDIKLATIDAKEFEKMMIHNLEIRNFGNSVLRKELAQKVEKEIGLASLTSMERLLKFREQYPMLENLIPHTDIASYLGITNISLSRLRSELAR
jgi:CRP-like cAMP-binding protein